MVYICRINGSDPHLSVSHSNKGVEHLSSMKKKNVVLLDYLLLEMLDANTGNSSRMAAAAHISNPNHNHHPATGPGVGSNHAHVPDHGHAPDEASLVVLDSPAASLQSPPSPGSAPVEQANAADTEDQE